MNYTFHHRKNVDVLCLSLPQIIPLFTPNLSKNYQKLFLTLKIILRTSLNNRSIVLINHNYFIRIQVWASIKTLAFLNINNKDQQM